ncbi:hypothetical protein SUGI_1145030 [Cryptomeria japonica]|nr:hypothetical protein SUGI_1145030 [Cryptomeria japonica]
MGPFAFDWTAIDWRDGMGASDGEGMAAGHFVRCECLSQAGRSDRQIPDLMDKFVFMNWYTAATSCFNFVWGCLCSCCPPS